MLTQTIVNGNEQRRKSRHRAQCLQMASRADPGCCSPWIPAQSDLCKWASLHHDLHSVYTDWFYRQSQMLVKKTALPSLLLCGQRSGNGLEGSRDLLPAVFTSKGPCWQENPKEYTQMALRRVFLAQMKLAPKHKSCSPSGARWGKNRWSPGFKWL